jgi:hypothetical protein
MTRWPGVLLTLSYPSFFKKKDKKSKQGLLNHLHPLLYIHYSHRLSSWWLDSYELLFLADLGSYVLGIGKFGP